FPGALTMAVALATLPLKSLLAGEGEWWMVAATGSGRAAWVAGALAAGAAGLAALPCTARGAGFFAAGFAATLLAGALPAAAFPGDTFFAGAFFTAGCFTTGCFVTAFLATTFFAGAFFTAALLAAVLPLAALLPAAAFLAGAWAVGLEALVCGAAFFGVALLAGFAAARAGDFAATLAACPLPATGFDLTALVPALLGVLPLCALAAVELALVFAISLHPDWPWGPRVIADAFNTGKPASGILVPLHGARRFGIREHPLPIHTVVAWFVQALAQPPAWH